jgi:hypothetical protein
MIESSLSFGKNSGLVGTLCVPEPDDSGNRPATAGIILFNAGIVHRIGPHRINVRLARALAKSGIPSIRFDLGGLGDSARAGGDAGFEAQAVEDIRAAMTTLGEATGLQRFGLFGFCSGAFHSYHTAHADERVAGLLLFEAYRYPTLKSSLIRLSLRFRQHGVLRTMGRLAWKTLGALAGKLRLQRVTETNGRAAEIGFIVDSTSKASFAQGVQSLLDRGVDVSLVFAGDGFEVYNYPDQFKDAFKHLGIADRVPTAFLPDVDHVATGAAAQAELIQRVLPWAARIAGVDAIRNAAGAAPGAMPPSGSSAGEAGPEVIVLSRAVTGPETVRCLGKAGIKVHAIYFTRNDAVKLSRYCRAYYSIWRARAIKHFLAMSSTALNE